MSDFQIFVDYTFPFFIGGLIIRFLCWTLAESLNLIDISLGKK